jgi:nitrite reductase/ring-hydroxylating ferredoxin subunit
MAETWHEVGPEAEFAEGLKMLTVGGRRVVVARLDGRLFAFDALCPHAGGPMERSEVEGTIVSCPLHAWRFDVAKAGAELHGYRSLAMKSLKTEAGRVYVAVQP